jgi:hypothetical protein
MRTSICLLVCCLLCPVSIAGTSVFRCVGSAGETVFSQTDCGVGAVTLDTAPVQAIGEGLRPAERAGLDPAPDTLNRRRGPAPVRTGRSAASANKQRYRCTRTRQQLESVRAERRRGYPAGKGRTLRERQAKYEAYLSSFCS